MMNDYIKINISNKNEFRCNGNLEAYGLMMGNLSFKIDTGCSHSVLPLLTAGISPNQVKLYQQQDFIDNSVKKVLSYGVNDDNAIKIKNKQLYKAGQFNLIGNALSCVKTVNNFTIDNVNLGNINIRINYTRTSNILIGMDILSKFDIHIAKDKTNNNITTLMMCSLSNITDDYLLDLEESFGISKQIVDATLRQNYIQ